MSADDKLAELVFSELYQDDANRHIAQIIANRIRQSEWLESVRAEARDQGLSDGMAVMGDLREVIAAYRAVIEKLREYARKTLDDPRNFTSKSDTARAVDAGACMVAESVVEILDAAPSAVLAERDARIRKQALLDAAQAYEDEWVAPWRISPWLRARADQSPAPQTRDDEEGDTDEQ